MTSKGEKDLEQAVDRLIAEGRPYDAMLEAYTEDNPRLMLRILPHLRGHSIEARANEAGPDISPEELVRFAEEAMLTDEIGMRIDLARRLMARANLTEEQVRERMRFTGEVMVRRYHETRRMRYFESAMKYFGESGAREPAIALARAATERFVRECGFVYLNDALEGLRDNVGLSDEEIAREVPLLGEWIPLHDRLKATGWFDRIQGGREDPGLTEGERAFDAFFASKAGRPFSSFDGAIRKNVVPAEPAALRFLFPKTSRRAAARVVRMWGIVVSSALIEEKRSKRGAS